MALFTGRFLNAVDAKGRLSLPAQMRAVVKERAVDIARIEQRHVEAGQVYIGLHPRFPCLRAFDVGHLPVLADEVEESVAHLTGEEKIAARELREMALFPELELTRIDEPGRIVLSAEARGVAGIGGSALILGNRGEIQIWDPQAYLDHPLVPEPAKRAAALLIDGKGDKA